MSISFSGLASGLDTSSWIESLVSLKKAKTTTLQTQKSNIITARNAVNNIKSYFSSFRSTIEKVTDTKFGISKLDLFAQNVAVSSNSSIVSASVTTDATEGGYNIRVQNIASTSEASSGFKVKRTETKTEIASSESKLSSLGITEGNVNITKDGITRRITIGEDDTLDSFMMKLSNIGVDSTYDETTGIFRLNSDVSSITDGGTGVISQLHLSSVNSGYTSRVLSKEISETNTYNANPDTLLSDIGVNTGSFAIRVNNTIENITISDDETLGSLVNKLNVKNITASMDNNGNFKIKDAEIVDEGTTDIISGLHLYDRKTISSQTQKSGILKDSSDQNASRDTLLSDLGISDGEFYVYKNGIRYNEHISAGETLGEFMDSMSQYNIQCGLVLDGTSIKLNAVGIGDSYIETIDDSGSNVAQKLFANTKTTLYNYSPKLSRTETTTQTVYADRDTLLSEYDQAGSPSAGTLVVGVNGDDYSLIIDSNETFGSLINKFSRIGVNVSLEGGKLTIQSGYDNVEIKSDGTSSLLTNIDLTVQSNLGGYSASSEACMSTTNEDVTKLESAINYANESTKLSLLNITKGSLSVYKDGVKATVDIGENDTFSSLKSKLSTVFSDVSLSFENGKLKIYSTTGAKVSVGTTTDESNLVSVCGLLGNSDGTVTSNRELYCVNTGSKLTESGLFAKGTVTKGTFIVGEAVISIDENTTMGDILSLINTNEKSNALASWDSVDGKLLIKAKNSGASFVNIESGTSNFTDIMGFTTTYSRNASGAPTSQRLNTEMQTLGQNAKFTINGTEYTSASNNVDSSISRIAGVTLNLKSISDNDITITISKDNSSLTNAVSDIVDAYNDLIENVESEMSNAENKITNQSTLKMLKNQIRTMMTSSIATTGIFKNLSSIGISLSAASSGDVSTSGIDRLSLDKAKFEQALNSNRNDVQKVLVGDDLNPGILSNVESTLEHALAATTGYFSITDSSYARQISDLDNKISKQLKSVERYRAMLEKKFSSMDRIISGMQNQYNSFLS